MTIPEKFHPQDVLVGIIIAFVSIPISMGYSLVSGLPVAYGLYGSLLPVIVFGLVSTSPRFVFGVDAAPAALVGGMLAAFGIASESAHAVQLVPVISLLVSLWLALFFLCRADRVLKFISQPVMGGFITGIGMTIICMQLPKLFGGDAGRGEVPELLAHIYHEAVRCFNLPSLLLGTGTVVVILTGKKLNPKIPMQPILMFVGAGLTFFFHVDSYGVKTLPAVAPGLPAISVPNLQLLGAYGKDIVIPSLSIAVVILSETLLATNNIALKYEDKINTRREILAYALSNLASSFSGCCPVNGSVSRTGIADQFGVRSQLMSLTAGLSMALILLFGTGFIAYLPVPVLTGIVISALLGTFEFGMAWQLRRVDRAEFFIFYAAFFAVLFLGTIYGVITGVLLAAFTFIIRQSKPSVDFLGVVPGLSGYYSLTRKGTATLPIRGVIIYRFSGPLFYANIGQCQKDIEGALRDDTNTVIIDASGIGSVDTAAAKGLLSLYHKLERSKIRLYITGHVSSVNDQLRVFGAAELIQKRAVRAKTSFALADTGLLQPYPVDESQRQGMRPYSPQLAEFEWAFGSESHAMMEQFAHRAAQKIADKKVLDLSRMRNTENEFFQGYWNDIEEEHLLDILGTEVKRLKAEGRIDNSMEIESIINARHELLEERVKKCEGKTAKNLLP